MVLKRARIASVATVYSKNHFEHLGKVFLSHASPDKPFVRGLAGRLRRPGVDVWLDERELVVGDSLPAEISEAIHNARAVIIVVSEASLRSDWLRHELRVAAQRMIVGQCRLIPVLRGDVDVPSEMTGLLYADCRPGRRGGTAKILDGLAEEARRLRVTLATMASADPLVRMHGLDRIIDKVFGPQGSGTAMLSATNSVDVTTVTVTPHVGFESEVVLDTLTDYGYKPEPVTIHDWDDWKSKVTDVLGERYGLLVTERAPSDGLRRALSRHEEWLWSERLPASPLEPGGAMVLVHIGLPITDEVTESRLAAGRDVLVQEVTGQVQPLPHSMPEAFARTDRNVSGPS